MPIEFRCDHCDRLLRTPDGTSGKDAKCPQCGAIVKIPAVSAPSIAPDTIMPPPRSPQAEAAAAQNPYQSPAAVEMRASAAQGRIHRGFQPTRIDMGEIISRTWQIYKTNLGLCIAGTLLILACGFFVNVIVGLGFTLVIRDARGGVYVAFSILQQVVGQAIGAYFLIGLNLFMLRDCPRRAGGFRHPVWRRSLLSVRRRHPVHHQHRQPDRILAPDYPGGHCILDVVAIDVHAHRSARGHRRCRSSYRWKRPAETSSPFSQST